MARERRMSIPEYVARGLAFQMFDGRKGHGGAPIVKRTLTHQQLENALRTAAERALNAKERGTEMPTVYFCGGTRCEDDPPCPRCSDAG